VSAPSFTRAALLCLDETGADWRIDLASLRAGEHTEETLLLACLLDGADSDREQGWREYVDTLVALALELGPVTDRQDPVGLGIRDARIRTVDPGAAPCEALIEALGRGEICVSLAGAPDGSQDSWNRYGAPWCARYDAAYLTEARRLAELGS